MEKFDLIVIGSGPGGYVAAIRAAQLGLSVAIIEKRPTMGGTCLNVGCIPSKALLDSTELFHQANTSFSTHGIEIPSPKMNMKKLIDRKNKVVSDITKGVSYLLSKNKIQVFQGWGKITSAHTVDYELDGKVETLTATHILIATGSEVATIPTVALDGKHIISSTEALDLTKIPKKLLIIGGGYVGVEMGSIFARLGSDVSVIEFMDRLTPNMDLDLSKALQKSLKKLGFTFYFNTKVTGAKVNEKTVELNAETKNGESITLDGDILLVCVGRKPFTDKLGLDDIGVNRDDKGCIEVNERFQSSIPSIYAIGDVIKGPMLAHKASEEGVAFAEYIAGQKPYLNYNTIPGVIYTWPEVAAVGLTEEELKASNRPYKKGVFPLKASGRARAAEESDGFFKVLSCEKTDEVLGVHMMGPRVADIIGEVVLAMAYRATAEDIGVLMHAHPTFSEGLKEASLLASLNHAIHL